VTATARKGIAPYVLLPGDPARVAQIAARWDSAREVYSDREFVAYTGTHEGVELSCVSTGIGCPSAGIAMEELARAGAHTFVRVGTCGTYLDHIAVGELVIFDAALRLDGASRLYAPPEFPAVADHRAVAAAVGAAERVGVRHHVGTTRTADTFYALHPRPGASFGDYWISSWRDQFADMRRMRIAAAEMETSIILVLARLWGLRAVGMAIVLDNLLEVAEETARTGRFDPATQLAPLGEDGVERLARVGTETLLELARQDAAVAR
jgi:uridine phosphorylase